MPGSYQSCSNASFSGPPTNTSISLIVPALAEGNYQIKVVIDGIEYDTPQVFQAIDNTFLLDPLNFTEKQEGAAFTITGRALIGSTVLFRSIDLEDVTVPVTVTGSLISGTIPTLPSLNDYYRVIVVHMGTEYDLGSFYYSGNCFITSVYPSTVTQNGVIIVKGQGFVQPSFDLPAENRLQVFIGDYYTTDVLYVDATEIRAVVANDTPLGLSEVIVQVNGGSYIGGLFVTVAPPIIQTEVGDSFSIGIFESLYYKHEYFNKPIYANGFFWNTFKAGANGKGALVKVSWDPQTFNVITTFGTLPLGSFPGDLMQASNGLLYGITTSGGGASGTGKGTIFSYDPAGTSNVQTLYTFNTSGSEGNYPKGKLVEIPNRGLYGLTTEGGLYGFGTIFNYSLAGVFQTIYHIQNPLAGDPDVFKGVGDLVQYDSNKLAFTLIDITPPVASGFKSSDDTPTDSGVTIDNVFVVPPKYDQFPETFVLNLDTLQLVSFDNQKFINAALAQTSGISKNKNTGKIAFVANSDIGNIPYAGLSSSQYASGIFPGTFDANPVAPEEFIGVVRHPAKGGQGGLAGYQGAGAIFRYYPDNYVLTNLQLAFSFDIAVGYYPSSGCFGPDGAYYGFSFQFINSSSIDNRDKFSANFWRVEIPALPTITSMVPSTLVVGQLCTLTGTKLNKCLQLALGPDAKTGVANGNLVLTNFNYTTGQGEPTLTFTVPNIPSGHLHLATEYGTINVPVTITNVSVIDSISASSETVNILVNATGSGFYPGFVPSYTGPGTLTFTYISSTSMSFVASTAGAYTIGANQLPFQALAAVSYDSLSTTSALVGSTITITGSGFSTGLVPSFTGGPAPTFTFVNSTTMTFIAPSIGTYSVAGLPFTTKQISSYSAYNYFGVLQTNLVPGAGCIGVIEVPDPKPYYFYSNTTVGRTKFVDLTPSPTQSIILRYVLEGPNSTILSSTRLNAKLGGTTVNDGNGTTVYLFSVGGSAEPNYATISSDPINAYIFSVAMDNGVEYVLEDLISPSWQYQTVTIRELYPNNVYIDRFTFVPRDTTPRLFDITYSS